MAGLDWQGVGDGGKGVGAAVGTWWGNFWPNDPGGGNDSNIMGFEPGGTPGAVGHGLAWRSCSYGGFPKRGLGSGLVQGLDLLTLHSDVDLVRGIAALSRGGCS